MSTICRGTHVLPGHRFANPKMRNVSFIVFSFHAFYTSPDFLQETKNPGLVLPSARAFSDGRKYRSMRCSWLHRGSSPRSDAGQSGIIILGTMSIFSHLNAGLGLGFPWVWIECLVHNHTRSKVFCKRKTPAKRGPDGRIFPDCFARHYRSGSVVALVKLLPLPTS